MRTIRQNRRDQEDDSFIDKAEVWRGPEMYMKEYQEMWGSITSGRLGPLLLFVLIISLVIATILGVNDIGYYHRDDVCLGNLCVVLVGWFTFLVIAILVGLLAGEEKN